MPNNSYLRSRKREQELVRAYREAGCISARSAASKSLVDCWSWNPFTKTVELVQIKTKKGGKTVRKSNFIEYKDCTVRSYTLHYE